MKKLLRPKKGTLVRYPNSSRCLSENGDLVEINAFWLRRLKDGDVEALEAEIFIQDEEKPTKKASKKKKTEKGDE